jgi:hypothetical protein
MMERLKGEAMRRRLEKSGLELYEIDDGGSLYIRGMMKMKEF